MVLVFHSLLITSDGFSLAALHIRWPILRAIKAAIPTRMMANGVMLEFDNGGRLEKIESRNGDIPSGIIPVQIMEIVKGHYPDADVVEYEVGRKTYEVKLSNRMELKFNRHFNVVEIDD